MGEKKKKKKSYYYLIMLETCRVNKYIAQKKKKKLFSDWGIIKHQLEDNLRNLQIILVCMCAISTDNVKFA